MKGCTTIDFGREEIYFLCNENHKVMSLTRRHLQASDFRVTDARNGSDASAPRQRKSSAPGVLTRISHPSTAFFLPIPIRSSVHVYNIRGHRLLRQIDPGSPVAGTA